MKICTVIGTRPEIIRLSRVIPKIDEAAQQVVIHTGQNYDKNLNDIFFDSLRLRRPDYFLGAKGSFGQQISTMFSAGEETLERERPDKLLVLGDTNSALLAIVAKRMGIAVYHMEAGNRCFSERSPEEINRRVIDHSSDILMPYTEGSRRNLIREGIQSNRIYVTGNPIFEVLNYYKSDIDENLILEELSLIPQNYLLVTVHRAENVDVPEKLNSIIAALDILSAKYRIPIIVSTHPHTKKLLPPSVATGNIRWLDPMDLFTFIKLEQNALCVLTDSGTVQEETCIYRVPNVHIRDFTERPETLECGSNIVSGTNSNQIVSSVDLAIKSTCDWTPPAEYLKQTVSDVVLRLLSCQF